MGEIISVISGKGGTGKTSICAAVASCLAAEGKRVLCIDADIGLRNLDISLGMADQPIIAFTDVMHGHYQLSDASEHPDLNTLFLLTAPIRESESDIDIAEFGAFLQRIRDSFDYCLIDSPAGIGAGFRLTTAYADRLLVISTPDPASMRDAERAAELLYMDNKTDVRLIVNRVTPKLFKRMELTVDDMMDEIGLQLIGIVPEDSDVILAAAEGEALIFNTSDGAAEACLRISRRLRGIPTPLMKL